MAKYDINKIKTKTNQGKLYYDFDEDIDAARAHAFSVCRKYNYKLQIEGIKETKSILKLFGSYGKNVSLEGTIICEFGFNFQIGDNVQLGDNFKLIDCNEVQIGNEVTIGRNVGIFTSKHAENPQYRADHWVKDLPITIGSNVMIGAGTVIGGGVTIGNNVIIEANSVIIKDIPDNVKVEGNPLKMKRLNFYT